MCLLFSQLDQNMDFHHFQNERSMLLLIHYESVFY